MRIDRVELFYRIVVANHEDSDMNRFDALKVRDRLTELLTTRSLSDTRKTKKTKRRVSR